ncbi:unnamed protein product [Choristocarpus tenellus]
MASASWRWSFPLTGWKGAMIAQTRRLMRHSAGQIEGRTPPRTNIAMFIAISELSHGRRRFSSTPDVTHQKIKGRGRFYKQVSVREVDGRTRKWEILLDSRTLKTPARRPLMFDSMELAMLVASEWDAQTNVTTGIEPATMPLMSLAATALDQIVPHRESTVSTCLKFLPTDTICFLVAQPDPALARKQAELWSPLREWIKKELAIEVATTKDIFQRPQHSPDAVPRAREVLEATDAWTLAAIQSVAMECKSLVIALALAFGHIAPQRVSVFEEKC